MYFYCIFQKSTIIFMRKKSVVDRESLLRIFLCIVIVYL